MLVGKLGSGLKYRIKTIPVEAPVVYHARLQPNTSFYCCPLSIPGTPGGAGGDIRVAIGSGDTGDGSSVVVSAGDTSASYASGGDVFVSAGNGTGTTSGSGGSVSVLEREAVPSTETQTEAASASRELTS